MIADEAAYAIHTCHCAAGAIQMTWLIRCRVGLILLHERAGAAALRYGCEYTLRRYVIHATLLLHYATHYYATPLTPQRHYAITPTYEVCVRQRYESLLLPQLVATYAAYAIATTAATALLRD